MFKEDLHYITADHLNTPRFATNQNGTMTWKWESDAFGVGSFDVDPDGDGTNVNIRLRFPGQYDDEESITFYNYFRDYDPTIGRYMQSDPIGLKAGSMNTFAYVNSTPTIAVDPYGEALWSLPVQAAIWIASSACARGFNQAASEWNQRAAEARDQERAVEKEAYLRFYEGCFKRFECRSDLQDCLESNPFYTDEVLSAIDQRYFRTIENNLYDGPTPFFCEAFGRRPVPRREPSPI